MLTLRRNVPHQDISLLSAGGRPVLLATLEVPFDSNLDGNLTDRPSTLTGLTYFDGHAQRRIHVRVRP